RRPVIVAGSAAAGGGRDSAGQATTSTSSGPTTSPTATSAVATTVGSVAIGACSRLHSSSAPTPMRRTASGRRIRCQRRSRDHDVMTTSATLERGQDGRVASCTGYVLVDEPPVDLGAGLSFFAGAASDDDVLLSDFLGALGALDFVERESV